MNYPDKNTSFMDVKMNYLHKKTDYPDKKTGYLDVKMDYRRKNFFDKDMLL